MTATYDAIVVGAGVAGSVATAALAGAGLSILVVEAGQRSERRLAGEWLHPPALAGLRALGFSLPSPGDLAVAMRGFAVFHADADAHEPTLLPYVCGGAVGLALGHGLLRTRLASQIAALDGVEIRHDARIVALDTTQPGRPLVTMRCGTAQVQAAARIVIAADGATSALRTMAGIGHRRRRLSTLLGVLVDREALPCPGFGHLFLGAPSPMLAYEVGGGRARLMFDLPDGPGAGDAIPPGHAAALPGALRAQLAQGCRTLRHNSHDITVERVVQGAVALVGDAGGSCHPLTATGMTMAVTDGLALQAALRDRRGDLGAALACYGRRRRAAQQTRRLIAGALYESCSGSGPELLVIRRGLERYWRADPRGRAASMALLAMVDVRLLSALREMMAVIRHGLSSRSGEPAPLHAMLDRPRLALGLSRLVARHLGEAMRVR